VEGEMRSVGCVMMPHCARAVKVVMIEFAKKKVQNGTSKRCGTMFKM
jgi:hypothetical protein